MNFVNNTLLNTDDKINNIEVKTKSKETNTK